MPAAIALLNAALATAMIANPVMPTLAEFEAVLNRHDSATLALEEWCALRGMAEHAHVNVQTLSVGDEAASPAIRARLSVTEGQNVLMRNVRLQCAGTVLSVARNWYVPDRLTPAMNAALQHGSTPFGKVVAPLNFRRQVLSTIAGPTDHCPPNTISTHQAMLVLPDGRPLAYLVECYTPANLANR